MTLNMIRWCSAGST